MPCLFPRGTGVAGSPSSTVSPGPRSTSIPSGSLVNPAVWPQQTWAENWGCASFCGELGPLLTQRDLATIQPFGHNTPTSRTDRQTGETGQTTDVGLIAVAEMGDRGHNRHGPKEGRESCAPFVERWEPV